MNGLFRKPMGAVGFCFGVVALFMWVWGFMAHHKTAKEGGCFLGLQRFSASDAVWRASFPPQEQHNAMLK
jgi:hypothetical protein